MLKRNRKKVLTLLMYIRVSVNIQVRRFQWRDFCLWRSCSPAASYSPAATPLQLLHRSAVEACIRGHTGCAPCFSGDAEAKVAPACNPSCCWELWCSWAEINNVASTESNNVDCLHGIELKIIFQVISWEGKNEICKTGSRRMKRQLRNKWKKNNNVK